MPKHKENIYCVSVKDLFVKFGNLNILNGLSFDIENGKIFGFLGPNGAGKSTTINVLNTLISPSSGNVKIFGKDVSKNASYIRSKIGVVLQQPSFEENITVERALDIHGILWGISVKERKARIKNLLERFDIESIKNTKNEELSIGQRRRVQVAREFMHDMDLLFLDEPTVGLDPSARRILLNFIKEKAKAGLTVFFTTHIMEEAEYICDKIAIINKGKIIAFDTAEGLRQKYSRIKKGEIKLKDDLHDQSIKHMLKALENQNLIIDISKGNIIQINTIGIGKILTKLLRILSDNNIEIENIAITPSTLEDIFFNVIDNSITKGNNNEFSFS